MPRPQKRVMVITARAGSKRAKNKNFAELQAPTANPQRKINTSLVGLAEQFCQLTADRLPDHIDSVVLSTDKDDYTPTQDRVVFAKRPDNLATDSATSAAVLEHLMRQGHWSVKDTMILVQPTSPFRNVLHTLRMIDAAENDPMARAVISCNKWKVRLDPVQPEHPSPDFADCHYDRRSTYTPNGNIYVLPPMLEGADHDHIDQYVERLYSRHVLAFEQKSPLLNLDVDSPEELGMVQTLLGSFFPIRPDSEE